MSLGKLFLERLKETPDNNSIGWIEQNKVFTMTFKEYFNLVAELSAALESLGFKEQSGLSILSQTRKEWHYLDIAAQCLGSKVVPIYPSYTAEEAQYIFNHSECTFLVVENSDQAAKILEVSEALNQPACIITIDSISKTLEEKLAKKSKVISFKSLLEMGKNLCHKEFLENFKAKIQSQDEASTATIIYTSGTTGTPKGVLISQKALTKSLLNIKSFMRSAFTSEDVMLTWLPLSHIFGRIDSFFPITCGSSSIYAEGIDRLIPNLALVKPTIMCAVPRIFEKIHTKVLDQLESGNIVKKKIFDWANKVSFEYFDKLQNDESPSLTQTLQRNLAYKIVFKKIYEKFGGKVKFFISGGAPLSPEIIEFLRNANLNILEAYGLSETASASIANPPFKQIPGTVGLPVGDTQVKLDEDGEILLKSESLFDGYFKMGEETKNAYTEDGWFKTGDIGEFNKEGFLKITDRKKDLIITSGGKNVAPQKIENAMKMQKYISQFMVVGDKKNYLTGIVALDKESLIPDLEKFGAKNTCDFQEVTTNKEIKLIIQQAIETVNKDLPQFETIKKFYIAPEEFTVEGGHLTPSLKLKKKVIFQKFEKEINAMYN